MTPEQQNRLWDAINRYAASCGGDPSRHVYGNTTRMRAVADVGAVIREAMLTDEQSGKLLRISAIVNALHAGDDGELTTGQARKQAIAAIGDALGIPF